MRLFEAFCFICYLVNIFIAKVSNVRALHSRKVFERESRITKTNKRDSNAYFDHE